VIVPYRIGKAKPSRDRKGAGCTFSGGVRKHGAADCQTHLIRQPAWVTYPDTGVPGQGLATEFQLTHGRASLGRAVRNMFL
jgi:hypothetical protein